MVYLLVENETSLLPELMSPIPIEEFFETYYEQSPLHIARKEKVNPYADLFSLTQLDHCLSRMINHNRVKVVKSVDNKSTHYPIHPSTQNPMSTFYDAFYEKNSIVVNGMHRHWDSAAKLAHGLIQELGFRVNINMYVTPPGATGFSSHWDGHDVLILQISGKKKWEFFEGGPDLPDDRLDIKEYLVKDNPGEPSEILILDPGDLLYVPRGLIHRASSVEATTSIHWTVGLHPPTMEDLLHASLRSWAKSNRNLRRSLPNSYLRGSANLEVLESEMRSLLKAASDEVHFQTALKGLKNPWDATRTCGDGHFQQLDLVDKMTLDSVVEKRNGDHLHLTAGLDTCLLTAPGLKYQPPGNTYQSISYMSRKKTFTAREITGWLNEEENLVLMRHLVRHGFLRVIAL
jgi:ribosomal protein L16 Arg81 hydroxylase